MEPNRTDRILDEWSSVARSATPPGPPPRGATTSVAGAGISLAGAAVLVVALVAVFAVLGNRPSQTSPGALPSASPSPSVAFASPEPATPVPATATPEPATPEPATPEPATPEPATPTPRATDDVCPAGALVPQITLWEGAAGSRIAHVELTNTSDTSCVVGAVNRVQLVDGDNNVLIDGTVPTTPSTLVIPSSGVATTLVEVSNYCGASPVVPVSLAFWLDGRTPTLSLPASATDTTTPPCSGPGQPGSIQMHPWSAS
jgi:hypothetical protein